MKIIIALIIFFCPITLGAQQSAKNNSSRANVQVKKKITRNTHVDDEIRLAKLVGPVHNKMTSIIKLRNEKYDLFNKLSDSSAKNKIQHDMDSLFKIIELLKSHQITLGFNFIRNNPSSFLSLDVLTRLLQNNAELPILCDTIKLLFNNLNKNIQNSVAGKKFQLMVANQGKSRVGNLAPDFKVKDLDGKEISLSDFRNKFVLLDFWASWCKPCRDDIPFVKDIYKTYKEKGLEIIGISKDDDLSSWKKAIAKDGTRIWRHIVAPLSIQPTDTSAITNKYFVYAIPVKILINKEGVIIGRWIEGGEENIAAIEKLLNEFL
jgi:peroxiredoxin